MESMENSPNVAHSETYLVEEEALETVESMDRFLETRPMIEAVAKVNEVLGNFREKGVYGGADIDIKRDFSIRRFPDLVGVQGHSVTKENHVEFIPFTAYSPKTIIHESLHLASNWRFVEANSSGAEIVKTGFARTKGFDSEENTLLPEQEYRYLNEGFTDFFARTFASGIEDEADANREEMLKLCEQQYEEEIEKDSQSVRMLQEKKPLTLEDENRLTILQGNIEYLEGSKAFTLRALGQDAASYDVEVGFVKDYLKRKAQGLRIQESEEFKQDDAFYEERVFNDAMAAYLNGDTDFLGDMDEIFGQKGALDELKSAKSGLEFRVSSAKYRK